jgi:hypothetical protein
MLPDKKTPPAPVVQVVPCRRRRRRDPLCRAKKFASRPSSSPRARFLLQARFLLPRAATGDKAPRAQILQLIHPRNLDPGGGEMRQEEKLAAAATQELLRADAGRTQLVNAELLRSPARERLRCAKALEGRPAGELQGSCGDIRWGNGISRRAAGEERREWIRWCGFT